MKVAVDAMGGDRAPGEIIKGALRAAGDGMAHILLVGDENRIKQFCPSGYPENLEVLHTEEYISMDENPSQALKRKKSASMLLAAKAVKEKKAGAMVSAGNTGALLECALLRIGRLQGVKRPAIITIWPTPGNPTVMLDSGANVDCKAEYLVQFARMGAVYSEKIMGKKNPRIALINIGHEEGKGNMLLQEAHHLMKNTDLNFIGNLEPRDFLGGATDVAVCDGFTGNLVLKTAESTAGYLFKLIKEAMTSNFINKIAGLILKPSFMELKARFDHSEHGGAPFLGIDGICIKSHGTADSRAIYNAIKSAKHCVENDLVGILANYFSLSAGVIK
ncbi:MAG: phosphate acyltransferase PlsX [Candidatus Eremiobacteraeota bacterium]|nr:phosphate acyltransferase PlsX [Candidatus Eremiobacteraeota bacterium]